MGYCTFGTIVTFFHLQEKILKEEDELLNLDFPWKNTPYAKIRKCLVVWDKELTFLDHPLFTAEEMELKLLRTKEKTRMIWKGMGKLIPVLNHTKYHVIYVKGVWELLVIWKTILLRNINPRKENPLEEKKSSAGTEM